MQSLFLALANAVIGSCDNLSDWIKLFCYIKIEAMALRHTEKKNESKDLQIGLSNDIT